MCAGQDDALAREVFGRPWEREALLEFLDRTARWEPDGPVVELAAEDEAGVLLGGGGIRRIGAGLGRGEAELSYWVLPAQRGHGIGTAIARALAARALGDARVHAAVLRIAPDNAGSARIAEAIGATRTGDVVEHPADRTRVADRWVVGASGAEGGLAAP